MRELPRFLELAHAWRGHLPTAIGLALTGLLAVQVARLAWVLLAPLGPVGAPLAAPSAAMPAFAPLATWGDPFHRRDVTANAATTGGIRLHGVRLGDGSGDRASSAILDLGSGQAAWRVGDTVASGIVLDAVAADHVWLRINGVRQRIALPSTNPGAAAGRTP